MRVPPDFVALAISIHALREEGDQSQTMNGRVSTLFLSTPSARRATLSCTDFFLGFQISIHALREEGDRDLKRIIRSQRNFYPRPPRGGRPP